MQLLENLKNRKHIESYTQSFIITDTEELCSSLTFKQVSLKVFYNFDKVNVADVTRNWNICASTLLGKITFKFRD